MRGQGAFEYIVLLGSVLFLVLFGILILRDTGPIGVGAEINRTLIDVGPLINSSSINESEFTKPLPTAFIPTPTPTPVVVVTPLPPARLVTACRLITSSGNYKLSGDLEGNQTCISIIARDVVLDCAGKKITGNGTGGTSGVYAVTSNNILVKNCTISGFSNGAYFDTCTLCSADGLNAYGNDNGVWFKSSPNAKAVGVTAAGNKVGIFLQQSSNFNASRNMLLNNAEGLRLDSSWYGVVEGNNATGNNGSGFYLLDASWNTYKSNKATDNGNGFYFTGYPNENLLVSNNASDNSGYGFFFAPGAGNNFTNNTICSNSQNLYCLQAQRDLGGNVCGTTFFEKACADSVVCGKC